jgi:hypothetical protein
LNRPAPGGPPPNAIYASEQFQRLTADSGIVCSMSGSGNVRDAPFAPSVQALGAFYSSKVVDIGHGVLPEELGTG